MSQDQERLQEALQRMEEQLRLRGHATVAAQVKVFEPSTTPAVMLVVHGTPEYTPGGLVIASTESMMEVLEPVGRETMNERRRYWQWLLNELLDDGKTWLLLLDIDGTLADLDAAKVYPELLEILTSPCVREHARIVLISNQRGVAWRWATGDAKFPAPVPLARRISAVAQAVGARQVYMCIGDERLVDRPGYRDALGVASFSMLETCEDQHVEAEVFREASFAKPSPRMLWRAMSDYPTPRRRVIFSGDRPEDMQAAAAAEVQFVPALELVAFLRQQVEQRPA